MKRLNKYIDRLRNTTVDGVCDEVCLELGKDPIHQLIVVNYLKMVDRKPITYNNFFPLRYQVLLSEIQVQYAEYIVVKRDTDKLKMLRKEEMQVIADIGK